MDQGMHKPRRARSQESPRWQPLSPLLLVRLPELAKVVIADGYHRLCAACLVDEDAVVRARSLDGR